MLFQRFRVLPDDVIEAEIEFVEGQRLRGVGGGFSGRIRVRLFVVDLQTGEGRVLEADVDADDVIHDRVGLVSLQRGGDRQASGGVAI